MTVDPVDLNNAMLEFAEAMKPVQDFLDGQREDMKRRGYSDETAQKIVVDLHSHLLWLMRGGQK
jgi:hypothetical protein